MHLIAFGLYSWPLSLSSPAAASSSAILRKLRCSPVLDWESLSPKRSVGSRSPIYAMERGCCRGILTSSDPKAASASRIEIGKHLRGGLKGWGIVHSCHFYLNSDSPKHLRRTDRELRILPSSVRQQARPKGQPMTRLILIVAALVAASPVHAYDTKIEELEEKRDGGSNGDLDSDAYELKQVKRAETDAQECRQRHAHYYRPKYADDPRAVDDLIRHACSLYDAVAKEKRRAYEERKRKEGERRAEEMRG